MGDSDICHNIPLHLLYVSPNQINALVPPYVGFPDSCPMGTQDVIVEKFASDNSFESSSRITTISIVQVAPALFSLANNTAAALHAYNPQVPWANPAQVSSSNPAHPGETISLYATGLGPSVPKCGNLMDPGCSVEQLANTPQVMIDGIQATVSFAGRAPGYQGLDQINVQVPAGAQSGVSVPVIVTSGGRTSNTVLLPIN
jgi:uncharacterized protein (TIGR03437 family)